ncbi:hypothetical protein ABKN59_001606 [Abortiporus biennis]
MLLQFITIIHGRNNDENACFKTQTRPVFFSSNVSLCSILLAYDKEVNLRRSGFCIACSTYRDLSSKHAMSHFKLTGIFDDLSVQISLRHHARLATHAILSGAEQCSCVQAFHLNWSKKSIAGTYDNLTVYHSVPYRCNDRNDALDSLFGSFLTS